MVKVIKFKTCTSKEGKDFISLKVQGGVEALQSANTGKLYLTAKSTYVTTTFDEQTAQALIGTELPGKVEKVSCEPYTYTIKESGEMVTLSHRYEYRAEDTTSEPSKPIAQEEVHSFM